MTVSDACRLRLVEVPCTEASFKDAVLCGLGHARKSLPCRFFYDAPGSRLFEEICELPEYYPTRTEEAILVGAVAEIASTSPAGLSLVELGSGSSRKTRLLIEVLLERHKALHYVAIDISSGFLAESARTLLARYPGLSVTAIGGEYREAFLHLPPREGPRLLLLLGGNIGNFEEDEAVDLLRLAAAAVGPDGQLLVGFDRLKDPRILENAYNDAAGVTAAFNKNLLGRINRELGGEFDVDTFEHAAPFVASGSRVEMLLVSTRSQTVRVEALGRSFAFAAGEAIHTESCHKYDVASFTRLAGAAGLAVVRLFSDPLGWFSLALLAP